MCEDAYGGGEVIFFYLFIYIFFWPRGWWAAVWQRLGHPKAQGWPEGSAPGVFWGLRLVIGLNIPHTATSPGGEPHCSRSVGAVSPTPLP